MKDGEKDGFKCIFKRQLKGKDVTVFQPTAQCMSCLLYTSDAADE